MNSSVEAVASKTHERKRRNTKEQAYIPAANYNRLKKAFTKRLQLNKKNGTVMEGTILYKSISTFVLFVWTRRTLFASFFGI